MVFSQFLAHSPPNPWNFLSAMSGKGVLGYIKEVTFGPHSRVGAGYQDDCPCDDRFGTFSPTPTPVRRQGRGLRESSVANRQ